MFQKPVALTNQLIHDYFLKKVSIVGKLCKFLGNHEPNSLKARYRLMYKVGHLETSHEGTITLSPPHQICLPYHKQVQFLNYLDLFHSFDKNVTIQVLTSSQGQRPVLAEL